MRREKVFRGVKPNAGIAAAYARRLAKLVDEMHASVRYWLKAAYRANPPAMAQDAPATVLQQAVRQLGQRWRRRFDDLAPAIAEYFATAIARRSDASLRAILRNGGFSVDFKMTSEMRDVLLATIGQQVGLIKSIPERYLTDVEGMVMRSVQTGRDLETLTRDLQAAYRVTRKRATLIARDQNNKATSAMTNARQLQLGIEEAIWQHSHAGKTPRPTHVKMDGKRYKLAQGMWDSAESKFIFPGELINCFPGSTRIQFADRVSKAYRRWYSGETVELVTASGKSLCGTPNHPILTSHGWVALQSLNEGDDVIEIADKSIFSVMPESNIQNAIPTLVEVFDACDKLGSMRFEVTLRSDFHGDAVASNVNIVDTARPLRFGLHALFMKSLRQFVFTMADQFFHRIGALAQFVVRRAKSFAGDVGRLSKAFSSGYAFPLHTNFIGLASAPQVFAGSKQRGSNGLPGNSIVSRQGKDALPGLVFPTQPTRIIKVKRSMFVGHVFNLETSTGWYVAEGIIAHNCRCTSRPIVPGIRIDA